MTPELLDQAAADQILYLRDPDDRAKHADLLRRLRGDETAERFLNQPAGDSRSWKRRRGGR